MNKIKISGNKSINELIDLCFEYITEDNIKIFIKIFSQHSCTSTQIKHTLRELVIGAYLSSQGYKVKYNFKYQNQTPDWCIIDNNNNVIGLLELTNLHIDKKTEDMINFHLNKKQAYFYWRDGNTNNINRLYQNILKKAQVYKQLVKNNSLPYIVAVFFDFFCPIDYDDELKPCLINDEYGLFKLYPELTNVVAFEEKNGTYIFNHFKNPTSAFSINLSDGVFPKKRHM